MTDRFETGPAGGFNVHHHTGASPEPRVVVLGGVHGDEVAGALAAGRLAISDLALKRGRVDVVPVCHEAAFAEDSRVSPLDGANLARVFPGNPEGSATQRLAHHIHQHVLKGCDLLIDLHTSGSHYDMPFLAGYGSDDPNDRLLSRQAAHAFGADFVWRHPGRSKGRTVSVVDEAIYVESPGSGPTAPSTVDAYVEGVRRVLAMLDMIDEPFDPPPEPVNVFGGGDLDNDMVAATHGGHFLTTVQCGDRVEEGETLGYVTDSHNRTVERLTALFTGRVMALKTRPPVQPGNQLVCLAREDG